MSILQFLRIFWARRMIVLIAMVASCLGAYVVTLLVSPRYEATAKVMLNFITRADPITGETVGRSASAFVEAQTELLSDYSVTGRVVDEFGWLSDPGRINAYQARNQSDTRDFRRWLSQEVADNTQTNVDGTVLNITYRAPSATMARVGAETLRRAFLDQSLVARRAEAAKNAQFYAVQAEGARKLAETAEMAKAAYERESGIIMDGRQSDLDSERLAALAAQSAAGPTGAAPMVSSSAALELAQIDAKMADLGSRLGPNHPEMQELRARRAALSKLASDEQSASQLASRGLNSMSALNQALAAQKQRVLSQRDKVERLRQLQAEVDLRRDQYRSAAQRSAQFLMESAAVDNGMTPLGVVVTPKDPVFPNKKLMVGGALALGTMLGLAIALLLELLNRRVRGVEDLHLSSEIPCVCVVEQPRGNGARFSWRRTLAGFRRPAVGATA